MSASRGGSGSGIKQTIKHLCDVLDAIGLSSVSPETIRQAKFDDPQAVSHALLHSADCQPFASFHL